MSFEQLINELCNKYTSEDQIEDLAKDLYALVTRIMYSNLDSDERTRLINLLNDSMKRWIADKPRLNYVDRE